MRFVGRVLRALASRQFILATIIVILGMGLLARLGFWQLDRLDQRRASNAQLTAVLESAPLNLNADSLPEGEAELKNRDAVAAGTFDFAYQGVIKLQNWQGRPGVQLVAPLVLDDGETAVLVNRGWVPEEKDRTGYAAYDEPGRVVVNGYVGLTQTLARQSASVAVTDELAWYRVDIAAIQAQLPYKLLPVYVKQNPDPNQDHPPFREAREIDLSEGPHLGYAIQWFLFSATLGVMYVVYIAKEIRKQ